MCRQFCGSRFLPVMLFPDLLLLEMKVWFAGLMPAARFCPSLHLPGFCLVTPPATSVRNQFKPGGSQIPVFCVSQARTVSCQSVPASMPCPGFPAMVCFLAVTKKGRQEDTSPGWPGESWQKGCKCLPEHKVFSPYLQGPLIAWHQAKSSSGELP